MTDENELKLAAAESGKSEQYAADEVDVAEKEVTETEAPETEDKSGEDYSDDSMDATVPLELYLNPLDELPKIKQETAERPMSAVKVREKAAADSGENSASTQSVKRQTDEAKSTDTVQREEVPYVGASGAVPMNSAQYAEKNSDASQPRFDGQNTQSSQVYPQTAYAQMPGVQYPYGQMPYGYIPQNNQQMPNLQNSTYQIPYNPYYQQPYQQQYTGYQQVPGQPVQQVQPQYQQFVQPGGQQGTQFGPQFNAQLYPQGFYPQQPLPGQQMQNAAVAKPKKQSGSGTGAKVFFGILITLAVLGTILTVYAISDIRNRQADREKGSSAIYEYSEKSGENEESSSDEDKTESSRTEDTEKTYTQPDIEVEPYEDGLTISGKPDTEELSAQQVYDKVLPSTVTVLAEIPTSDGSYYESSGSGIIITESGFLITNSHVIGNTKSSVITVTTSDGEKHECITVGFDKTTDLAVLKMAGTGYVAAELGKAEELSIGEWVIAIGTPGGSGFSGSLTRGVISGLDREVGTYSSNGMTYIQTDAAINPGNSGGPLVNMYGQVVGINSSKIVADYYEGMGFAIPISKAEDIIEQLLSAGYVEGRVRLGIMAATYYYGTIGLGVEIISIDEDSAFTGTEAQAGDIITAIDDVSITDMTTLANALLSYKEGDEAEVNLVRVSEDGNSEEITVTIKLISDEGQTQK